ncbi:alpha-L-rhamnosidase [Sphingobacterium griseoflavum]|uniref:alpha-L-rhamnosidase n=1 Tax=Sphingobacterium griseoflavum TaxID=1474952 RepID=A0ABQ3HYE4_9SPHI|nr:alpha-L-rhamnosidase [Sphingobacterium griseoflavum]GHE47013.1 hydrolase [Sphingobacterium griseoflavum]
MKTNRKFAREDILRSKKIIVFMTLFNVLLLHAYAASTKLTVHKVLIAGRENPLGINTLAPSFSWQLLSDGHDVQQQAYKIEVSRQRHIAGGSKLLWDSGWITSAQSLHIPYAGAALAAGSTYYVRLHVQDNQGNTAVSAIQSFHTGLLQPSDWGTAKWIAKEILPDSLINPLPLSSSKLRIDKTYDLPVFRKNVRLNRKVTFSMAYISGLGHYELLLNDKPVDDALLQPGWTKYDKEAYYVVYDLTPQWKKGKNTLAVLLGNGFYYIPPIKGRFQKHKVAFGLPKLKIKIVNTYDDGQQETIVSDESWKVASSPITFSSMYGGEDYDASKLPASWSQPNFDDRKWNNALLVDGPALTAQETDPVRVMQEFTGQKLQSRSDERSEVYDFGQNAAGIISLKMKGKPGDTVRVYPAELLNENGLPNQKHSGSPYYFQYIFGAEGEVTWHPRFTYYGFRYAQVQKRSKAPNSLQILDVKARHIRNSARQIGTFHSSDSLFNEIHRLIDWAIKSNMMSVFTDCPHREKLGWLEQLHLMGPSVQYNYDVARLFKKSLRDMRFSQTEDGLVPEIAPEYVQFDWGGDMFRDSPEWGSSAVLLAWYAYQWYGDKTFLTENYPMMKRYITYLQSKAKGNILYQGLGDWYDLGPERPGVSQLTPAGITATAIYYDDLKVLANIATIVGDEEGKLLYDSLKTKVYDAFQQAFFHADSASYGSGSQTSLAMPLYSGLVDSNQIMSVFENLVADIAKRDTAFTAGDIGHRYLLQVLQQQQRDDLIFAMHRDDSRPGYGYQIRKGATALTESWAALPNVSNNHFMLGHLMEWFHAGLGGLRQEPTSIAYRHIRIAPRLLDRIAQCHLDFESPYGKISVHRNGNDYQLAIPVNSFCTLLLPADVAYSVNGSAIEKFKTKSTPKGLELSLGSGVYQVTSTALYTHKEVKRK